jgi:hypothetical protein
MTTRSQCAGRLEPAQTQKSYAEKTSRKATGAAAKCSKAQSSYWAMAYLSKLSD